MPEKRRNKNKNKRKNKNNRPDASHTNNNTDVKEKNTEKCNDQPDVDTNNEPKENDEVIGVKQNTDKQNVTEIPDTSGIAFVAPSVQICNQDLNNNSNVNTAQALTVLVQNLGVPSLINELPLIVDVTDGCVESQHNEAYIVESPEQSLKTKSNKTKLTISIKSKSLDNEDEPKIVEITEDINTRSEEDNALAVIDTNNVIVSDIESDFEWEKADELHKTEVTPLNETATGTVSITAVPLNVAQCHQTKPLTPEMEISLRNYLKTLDLSSNPENIESVEIKAEIEQIINREIKHRLRKKAQTDDFTLQRPGPPRMLDVIDEEGSSESSMTSRRQSYLSDKKSDIDDLDDDVFEAPNKASAISQKVASSFPKKTFGRLVPQECVLVGAKIKDPDVTEARGDWTMSTVEKMTGAEVVYLTDTSSSSSSLHDLEDENDDGVETDVSVRMITPTIEVTDTENLLKNTFIPETKVGNCYSLPDTEKNNISHQIKGENPHEILVLSTDDIKTNLYVKDIQTQNSEVMDDIDKIKPISKDKNPTDHNHKHSVDYDLEMKVLKCELNDAINNLIKEVSDSELNENSPSMFSRQDSSSSVCSSQCTAKYNPTHSSLNDVSNIVHDEVSGNNKPNVESTETSTTPSHVKEVFEHVTGTTTQNKKIVQHNSQPLFLRDICVKRIAKFPYGDKILEELASVSERLQNIATRGFVATENSTTSEDFKKESSCHTNMPYFPLPDLSSIEKVILPSKIKDSVPPPVQPRHSSLKREKSREEDVWTGVPTKNEPVYVCLSPSQKMLMEKTNTVLSKDDASELVNTHKNYVERRGYNECFSKQNHKDKPDEDITPIVPFKSQTGSRLLALIRDPKLTNSISSINKHCSSDNFENITATQNVTIRNSNRFGSNSDTFRPIPPPRPKKMSSFYESDESSDFTDSSLRSMKSERKFFHYSTGNLSKEIEDDVSSIQQMHKNYTNARDKFNDNGPRRPSLPKDLCDQQMEYIRRKEKEVEAEIQRLEAQSNKVPSSTETKISKAPYVTETECVTEKYKDSNNFFISKHRDFFSSSQNFRKTEKPEKGRLNSVFSRSQEELLREKMYSEYVTQMAEREERKQHKVIKITNTPVVPSTTISKSMPALDILDSKVNNRIEKEFICKARERWDKLGIKDPETEDERESARSDVYREPKVIEHKIKVIEGEKEREIRNLPRHLQEFVRFTAKDMEKKADSSGESEGRPASPHVMIWCAVIIIVIAVGKYFLRLFRYK